MPGPSLADASGGDASPLKITYQSFGQITGMEHYQAFLRAEVAAAVGPGVDVEVRCLDHAVVGGKGLSSAEALELPNLLRSVAGAIADGAEAVAIANGFDPGLWQSRELFDVPVLGLFETVAFHGLRMGARLGVLCSGRNGPGRIQELLFRYGIATRFAVPRALGIGVPAVVSAFEDDRACARIAEEVDKSLQLLAADGAELVLIASGALGALIRSRQLDKVTIIPVLPNTPILARELVAAAALSRLGVPAVSRVGRFAGAPDVVRESLLSAPDRLQTR
jgi:Asp/Glu/hydantoin racemase